MGAGTFAAMLSADVIRQVWENIVTRHKAGISFRSVWSVVKDDDTATKYPACYWRAVDAGMVSLAEVLAEVYIVRLAFMEQTASARTNTERDQAHSRMLAIAMQCWTLFHDLYLVDNGLWQGVPVDLEIQSEPTFLPAFDVGTRQETGVVLTATFKSVAAPLCVDEYFNAVA